MIHLWNRVAVCILCGVLVATVALSQVQQNSSGKYKYTTVKNDPLGVRIYTLPNGLTVYTSVNKVEPRIQTLISVRAGSKNDPADATGLAHYLEHMVFKGTDKYGTLDFAKEKPLIDQVEQLYETYRGTRDSAERARIYRQIDSVSGLAAKYSIANEYDKMVSALGAKGTNAHTASEETVYENDIPANQLRNWLTLEAERFRNPILRLFHTELEAVYEEKNRTLDNDGRQSYEKLMAGLFKKHTYGTQTTIGTIEHLKNPSMKKIREYYNTYYVPNNMAIILCGDFNPDEAIAMIDETFGKYAPKTVPVFTPAVEDPITSPTVIDVYGPSAEQVRFAYRFPGVSSPDVKLLTMCDMILSNSQTGLIDLNIKQKQKALNAGCTPSILKDYSYHTFSGSPRKGQKLEDVVQLLQEQIEELKKGNFDESMMKAIVTNMRIQQIKQLESNESRANALSSCFIEGRNWADEVVFFDELAKITKQQVVDFAKKHYTNNYVVVYKRTGENKNLQKVPKPAITPVTINKDQSPFVKSMLEQFAKAEKINPKFSDFRNDIARATTNGIQIFSVRNTENDLFTLQYVWDMGTRHDKKSALAVQYMDLLGTAAMNADQVKEKFYELGCTMDARVGNDQMTIEITGINGAMKDAMKLTDELLLNAKPDEQSLKLMVEGMLKQRADARKNKGVVLNQALANYVQFGKRNPFTDVMNEKELRAVTAAELCAALAALPTMQHRILYDGPLSAEKLATVVKDVRGSVAASKPIPSAEPYTFQDNSEGGVYFVDFDMVQAEVLLRMKTDPAYSPTNSPYSRILNEYIGGMSGVVFQTIRESKALAYSSEAYYMAPRRKTEPYYMGAYIGTQADKLPEALGAMQEIMNELPRNDASFQNAKQSITGKIESERIRRMDLLAQYESLSRLGLDYDIRMKVYEQMKSMSFDDMVRFMKEKTGSRKFVYLVLGSKKKINLDELKKYGFVRELTLDQIFGS